MPDRRAHRGEHPKDAKDFDSDAHLTLCIACSELSWLLTRNYSAVAALKLVGDRHQLTARQRLAVLRSACSDRALASRRETHLSIERLAGERLGIDGFNVLITLEAMMSGAPVFVGRDGAHRDLASVHGTYRRVAETLPSLDAIRGTLEAHGVARAVFYLDRPVSNSGRLRALIERTFAASSCAATVELHDAVDPVLVREEAIVASSDSWVLDHAKHWIDLPAAVAHRHNIAVKQVVLAAS